MKTETDWAPPPDQEILCNINGFDRTAADSSRGPNSQPSHLKQEKSEKWLLGWNRHQRKICFRRPQPLLLLNFLSSLSDLMALFGELTANGGYTAEILTLTHLLHCPCRQCRAFPWLRDTRPLSSLAGRCSAIHWLPGCISHCCCRNPDNPLGIRKEVSVCDWVEGSRLVLTVKSGKQIFFLFQ